MSFAREMITRFNCYPPRAERVDDFFYWGLTAMVFLYRPTRSSIPLAARLKNLILASAAFAMAQVR